MPALVLSTVEIPILADSWEAEPRYARAEYESFSNTIITTEMAPPAWNYSGRVGPFDERSEAQAVLSLLVAHQTHAATGWLLERPATLVVRVGRLRAMQHWDSSAGFFVAKWAFDLTLREEGPPA